MPEQVEVTFADGTVERLPFPAEERWHRWQLVRPVKVKSARMDADQRILLDLDKLDDGRARKTSGQASVRWGLEATNLFELLLSCLVSQ